MISRYNYKSSLLNKEGMGKILYADLNLSDFI